MPLIATGSFPLLDHSMMPCVTTISSSLFLLLAVISSSAIITTWNVAAFSLSSPLQPKTATVPTSTAATNRMLTKTTTTATTLTYSPLVFRRGSYDVDVRCSSSSSSLFMSAGEVALSRMEENGEGELHYFCRIISRCLQRVCVYIICAVGGVALQQNTKQRFVSVMHILLTICLLNKNPRLIALEERGNSKGVAAMCTSWCAQY